MRSQKFPYTQQQQQPNHQQQPPHQQQEGLNRMRQSHTQRQMQEKEEQKEYLHEKSQKIPNELRVHVKGFERMADLKFSKIRNDLFDIFKHYGCPSIDDVTVGTKRGPLPHPPSFAFINFQTKKQVLYLNRIIFFGFFFLVFVCVCVCVCVCVLSFSVCECL